MHEAWLALLLSLCIGCSLEESPLLLTGDHADAGHRRDAAASHDAGDLGDAAVGRDAETPHDASASDASKDAAMDASTEDGGKDAEVVESCDDIFGSATDYDLCEETAESCLFYVYTRDYPDKTCEELCNAYGRDCWDGWDNVEDEHCQRDEEAGCNLPHWHQICLCAK